MPSQDICHHEDESLHYQRLLLSHWTFFLTSHLIHPSFVVELVSLSNIPPHSSFLQSLVFICEAMTHIQPGPIDGSLLCLQNHISNKVWEGEERMICPRCNYVWSFTHLDRIDNRVKNLINETSFGRVITISQIDINQHLVTALIERWRPKTHISFSNWALRLTDGR